MNLPLVTIVTPSYNQGHFIAATIESVLSQDYPHIEYISMDGASTDATADAVRPYLDRLTYISEKDRGQTHAINKGFQMAKGEIVAYLNSDDTLLPTAVSRAVEALAKHPTVGAIYGDGFQIDFHGNIKQRFPFTGPFNLWKLTHLSDYILQQSTFFRRSCLEQLGWLDEDLHFGMDWDILIRLGKQFGLVYIPGDFGCLREYDEAKSFSGGVRRFDELARILRLHSGQERPPGWWFYGCDTYDKIGSSHIRRWIPGPLGRHIAARFVQLCRARIDAVSLHAQGLYADNSVGPRFHWMTPAPDRALILRGDIPQRLPRQHLRTILNGQLADDRRLGPGPFEIRLTLPAGAPSSIRVESASSYTAHQPIRRQVAWQLESIESRP